MQTQATEELHIETTHYKFTVHVTNRFYNNIHVIIITWMIYYHYIII